MFKQRSVTLTLTLTLKWRSSSYSLIKKKTTNKLTIDLQTGFYAQINSPEDARKRVVDYGLVMARPMVLYQADHPIHWSPVFVGGSSGNIGYVNERQRRLVTTVSTPVFDRRNHSDNVRAANLLGVVGADVSIEEIVKMVPQYKVRRIVVNSHATQSFYSIQFTQTVNYNKTYSLCISRCQLGANGYSFIVDNNGKVLYHPDLRLTVIKSANDGVQCHRFSFVNDSLSTKIYYSTKNEDIQANTDSVTCLNLFSFSTCRTTNCNMSIHYNRNTVQSI